MPRPSRERKSGLNLRSPDQQGNSRESRLNQNLYYERPGGRETMQFLNNLQRLSAQKVVEDTAELKAELAGKAEQAALTGEVDPELYEQYETYREVLGTTQGRTKAKAFGAQLLQDVQDHIADEGSGFDVEAFISERVQQFTDSDEYANEYFSEGSTGVLQEYVDQARAASVKAVAAEADQAAIDTALESAFVSLADTKDFDFSAWDTAAEELGLTRKEKGTVLASAAMSALGQAESEEDLEFYSDLMDKLSPGVRAQYGEQLSAAYEAAESRVTEMSEAQKVELTKRKTDALVGHMDRIYSDNPPSVAELEALRESFPEDDFETEYRALRSALRSRNASAAKDRAGEAAAAQYYEDGVKMMLDPDFRTYYYGMEPAQRSRFQKEVFEPYFSGRSIEMLQTANAFDRAETPEEREALSAQLRSQVTGMKPMLATANIMNYQPRAFEIFDNINPRSPDFRSKAELYDTMASYLGPDFVPNMGAEDRAAMDMYLRHTKEFGLSHDDALDLMADDENGPTLRNVRTALRNHEDYDDVRKDAFENLSEDARLLPHVQDKVEELAAAYMRQGSTIGEAFTQATKVFDETHELIGGAYVPNRYIPKGFGLIWDEYQPLLQSHLAGNVPGSDLPLLERFDYDSSSDLYVLPHDETRVDGSLAVFALRKDGTFGPIRKDDGTPAVIYPAQAISEWGAAQGAKSEAEAREMFEDRRRGKKFGFPHIYQREDGKFEASWYR